MNKFSIVSINNFDEATITIANTVPNLGANWLHSNLKSEFCRINAGTATITATWTDSIGVDIVALPTWNGTIESEIRIRLYEEVSGGSPTYDTGWEWAAGGPTLANWNFHQPLNANSFALGATTTTVHIPNLAAKRVVIDIKDPTLAYIDIAKVIIGTAFTPNCNPDYGSSSNTEDMGKQIRAASGDVIIDRGPVYRKLSLSMNTIHTADRHMFSRIMNQGIGNMVYVSVVPDEDDITLTQDWSMYGTLKASSLTYSSFGSHQTTYEIEEW